MKEQVRVYSNHSCVCIINNNSKRNKKGKKKILFVVASTAHTSISLTRTSIDTEMFQWNVCFSMCLVKARTNRCLF